MDGPARLTSQSRKYAKPWPDCISIGDISVDNLPPFFRRLNDEQVGHLSHWVKTESKTLTMAKLKEYWPWDFNTQGKPLYGRGNWGKAYAGDGPKPLKDSLSGSEVVPVYVDPGMRLTRTSMGKEMRWEPEQNVESKDKKRAAEDMFTEGKAHTHKRLCLGNRHSRDKVVQSLITTINEQQNSIDKLTSDNQGQQLETKLWVEKAKDMETKNKSLNGDFKQAQAQIAELKEAYQDVYGRKRRWFDKYESLCKENEMTVSANNKLKSQVAQLKEELEISKTHSVDLQSAKDQNDANATRIRHMKEILRTMHQSIGKMDAELSR